MIRRIMLHVLLLLTEQPYTYCSYSRCLLVAHGCIHVIAFRHIARHLYYSRSGSTRKLIPTICARPVIHAVADRLYVLKPVLAESLKLAFSALRLLAYRGQ